MIILLFWQPGLSKSLALGIIEENFIKTNGVIEFEKLGWKISNGLQFFTYECSNESDGVSIRQQFENFIMSQTQNQQCVK